MSTAVGVVLVILGLIALATGIAGGVAQIFLDLRKQLEQGRSFGPAELPTEVLQALTEFTEALTKAPQWLALVIIGLLLVIYGSMWF
jgi:hypothetical protein